MKIGCHAKKPSLHQRTHLKGGILTENVYRPYSRLHRSVSCVNYGACPEQLPGNASSSTACSAAIHSGQEESFGSDDGMSEDPGVQEVEVLRMAPEEEKVVTRMVPEEEEESSYISTRNRNMEH